MSADAPHSGPPAVRAQPFLRALNPLAKILAPLPAMVGLVFARDVATPLAFLLLAVVLVLLGARPAGRILATLLLALPAGIVVVGAGLALWTDPARIDRSLPLVTLGGWTLFGGALETGLATGLRLGAIVALALIGGLSTTGGDLARSLVQQLRVPYRVGYAAIAAFRFVPRFRSELQTIRQAHRVRGAAGGRGPFAALARGAGYGVPLLAGAIRHAERVALAMDARAFGAHPTRTERHLVPFRRRDAVFVAVFWAATAALFLVLPRP